MPINKNASYRYRLIDSCLSQRYKRWRYKDLLEHISAKVAEEFDIEKGISKRQFDYDIQLMRRDAPEGFGAPIVRINEEIYYEDPEFSILNQPLREEEKAQLYEALGVLGRFQGMPQFEWMEDIRTKLGLGIQSMQEEIVQFDSNPYLTRKELLTPLFEHIRQKNTIQVRYQSFHSTAPEEYIISPYLIKEYNNRWFLFGHRTGRNYLYNVPLDRIEKISASDSPFVENQQYDLTEYFEDVIGVSVPTDQSTVKIILRATLSLAPYIETKPLHGSQKTISRDNSCVTFSIELSPNFELFKTLLSHGEDIEVMEPDSIRKEMAGKIKKLNDVYSK